MSQKEIECERLSRRRLLGQLAGAGLSALPGVAVPARVWGQAPAATPEIGRGPLTPEDDQFLEELEQANFLFFWEQGDAQTGLVKDRSRANPPDTSTVASIASTGFGLTAICIGHERGYVSVSDARERVITALRFLLKKMPTHRGFFYHWANVKSGDRIWDSEISSIDTAILLCGS